VKGSFSGCRHGWRGHRGTQGGGKALAGNRGAGGGSEQANDGGLQVADGELGVSARGISWRAVTRGWGTTRGRRQCTRTEVVVLVAVVGRGAEVGDGAGAREGKKLDFAPLMVVAGDKASSGSETVGVGGGFGFGGDGRAERPVGLGLECARAHVEGIWLVGWAQILL
jgi:hypothetical protein